MKKSDRATKAGIANEPSIQEVKNLTALIEKVLDPLREAYGKPIIVTSGYRCPKLNAIVGSTPSSQHVKGEAADIKRVESILGNAVQSLNEPNLVSVFIGMVLGLIVGSIPLSVPGISLPVKLGLAGGPIIVGILIGTFGPRMHMVTYTTRSANMMLRAIGLNLYLACLGLDAGAHFFETVVRPEGLLWIILGLLITFVPVVLTGILALRVMKLDFGSISGLLCGSMANPMALNYANDTIEGDNPSVAYATVYPVCMFLRVIIIQLVVMFFV